MARSKSTRKNLYCLEDDAQVASEKALLTLNGNVVVVTEQGCSEVTLPPGPPSVMEPGPLIRLAESLASGELVPPLGVSPDYVLEGGNHRLHAAQLLATPVARRHKVVTQWPMQPEFTEQELERISKLPHVPEVELRIDESKDPLRGIKENAHRRQMTPALIEEQFQKLVALGYREAVTGRPKADELPSALHVLAELWNVTPRRIQQQRAAHRKAVEGPSQTEEKSAPQTPARRHKSLLRSAQTFLEASDSSGDKIAELARALVAALQSELEQGRTPRQRVEKPRKPARKEKPRPSAS